MRLMRELDSYLFDSPVLVYTTLQGVRDGHSEEVPHTGPFSGSQLLHSIETWQQNKTKQNKTKLQS
jgi:hypothetical protein